MSGSSQEYRIVGWVELISSAAKESNTSVVARLAKIKSTLLPPFLVARKLRQEKTRPALTAVNHRAMNRPPNSHAAFTTASPVSQPTTS